MCPKSSDWCVFIRGRRENWTWGYRRDTHREEGHMKTKAEVGVMLPQAKECQEPAEAGRGRKAPPQGLQREQGPADTLISDF